MAGTIGRPVRAAGQAAVAVEAGAAAAAASAVVGSVAGGKYREALAHMPLLMRNMKVAGRR